MIVENRTSYPGRDVQRLIDRAFGLGRGPRPRRVIVAMRTGPRDDRLGWTPDDHRDPMLIWLEPAAAYPQPGARSWRDELWQTSLHEIHHYRDGGRRRRGWRSGGPDGCSGCEVRAEAYAQRYRWRRPR